MKKALLYAVVAVTIGLLTVLIPFFTFAKFRTEDGRICLYVRSERDMDALKSIYDGRPREQLTVELGLFGFSFAVALTAYLFFRFRMSHQRLYHF